MTQKKTILRKPSKLQELTVAELNSERDQLLVLRNQPQVDKKLIDLALKSQDERMSTEEISAYLGRERQVEP